MSSPRLQNLRLKSAIAKKKPKPKNAFISLAVDWKPFPNSPQEAAYNSLADELFYGGAAGGGKSALILGLAGTAHRNSIIFRRVFPNTRALIEDSRAIYNREGSIHSKDSYNESLHVWRLADKRMIEFGAIQYEKDKVRYRGRPHDLYAWDEITEFTEGQYRFVNAWNRTTVQGQRCRVVATGNPPTQDEGTWIIKYWGAWLDPDHANPAKFGELVWYSRINDEDVEVGRGNIRPAPIREVDKSYPEGFRLVYPKSRTFIPARLEDNPILMQTDYAATLDALPEPLRSQMRLGLFLLTSEDNPWQLIPTDWIKAGVERWKAMQEPITRPDFIGCDVARGGGDKTVLCPRWKQGNYIGKLQKYAGKQTRQGSK